MEELPAKQNILEVFTDDWKFSLSDPNVNLMTKRAFQCVVVAVYSKAGSYLGHFSDPPTDISEVSSAPGDKVLSEMLDDIKTNIDPSVAFVWVGGSTSTSEDAYAVDDEAREILARPIDNFNYVKQKLIEAGFNEDNIVTAMSGHNEEVEVSLNTGDGQINVNTVKEEPEPSMYHKQEYWDFKRESKSD